MDFENFLDCCITERPETTLSQVELERESISTESVNLDDLDLKLATLTVNVAAKHCSAVPFEFSFDEKPSISERETTSDKNRKLKFNNLSRTIK